MDFGPVEFGNAPENPYSAAQIARGAELVAFGGCNDCHTPYNVDVDLGMPVPDMSRMLSGHPRNAPDPQGTPGPMDAGVIGPTFTSFRLPFGTVYALNLTPDIDTGIGTWTEEMFLGIFRKGRHLGGDGRVVLPPMPWWSVASLSDEDIVSIFAYLRSLPPIVNAVPSSEIPPPALEALATVTDAMLEEMAAAGKR
jgi:mono/diheme cytochrome c family protein